MKYIAAWSGGADSTASVILAHLFNEPLDEIIFVEVMYDCVRNISGESPRHIHFINHIAKPIFEEWGYKVTILRSESDYLSFFNRRIERPTVHMDHKGKRFGFPVYNRCGIQRDLKRKPFDKYLVSCSEPYIKYLGICADEKRRLLSLERQPNNISLLQKYGYTTQMTKALCSEFGLLSPFYSGASKKRSGCWFCCNAKLEEQQEIKKLYPDVWSEFVSLEDLPDLAFDKYNPFGRTLHEIDSLI